LYGVALRVGVKPPYVLVRKLKVQYGEPGHTIVTEAGIMPMSMICNHGVPYGWERSGAYLRGYTGRLKEHERRARVNIPPARSWPRPWKQARLQHGFETWWIEPPLRAMRERSARSDSPSSSRALPAEGHRQRCRADKSGKVLGVVIRNLSRKAQSSLPGWMVARGSGRFCSASVRPNPGVAHKMHPVSQESTRGFLRKGRIHP
jgi:hypothetical protein